MFLACYDLFRGEVIMVVEGSRCSEKQSSLSLRTEFEYEIY